MTLTPRASAARPARRSTRCSRDSRHMSQEEWSDFLRFAELQRVYLRTLQLLEKWAAADRIRGAV